YRPALRTRAILCLCTFFLSCSGALPPLHSFPTRRSSDLKRPASDEDGEDTVAGCASMSAGLVGSRPAGRRRRSSRRRRHWCWCRSEEHTSELQSRENLVCRLLLEKKKHKEIKTTLSTQPN